MEFERRFWTLKARVRPSSFEATQLCSYPIGRRRQAMAVASPGGRGLSCIALGQVLPESGAGGMFGSRAPFLRYHEDELQALRFLGWEKEHEVRQRPGWGWTGRDGRRRRGLRSGSPSLISAVHHGTRATESGCVRKLYGEAEVLPKARPYWFRRGSGREEERRRRKLLLPPIITCVAEVFPVN